MARPAYGAGKHLKTNATGKSSMNASPPSDYNADYARWKAWERDDFGSSTATERAYFNSELASAGIELRSGLRVLEIGFGNGGALMHLRAIATVICGTEANAELIARAIAKGVDARPATALCEWDAGSFDAVLAFDVLEHVPQDELPAMMRQVRRLLVPGGHFLARFPNGDSPLGLALQNGDASHVTAIGSAKARHLFEQAGFAVTRVGKPAQPWIDPDPKRTAYNLLVRPVRAAGERIVKFLYFAGTEIHFFSGNLIVVGVATKSADTTA